jgi:hypothetical protein
MPCNLFVVRKTERRKLGKVAVRVKEYRGRVWEKIRGATAVNLAVAAPSLATLL